MYMTERFSQRLEHGVACHDERSGTPYARNGVNNEPVQVNTIEEHHNALVQASSKHYKPKGNMFCAQRMRKIRVVSI